MDGIFTQPGDNVILRASLLNKMMQMVHEWETGRMGGGRSVSYRSSRTPLFLRVKNDSDADVPCFGVLEITNPLFEFEGTAEEKKTAAKRSAMNAGVELKGGKPSGEDGKITVITQESVPAGKLGRAVLTGTTAVAIDVKDTGHKYAVPVKDDVTKLETSDSGAWRVVNPLTETGEQIAYVAPAGGGGGDISVELGILQTTLTSKTAAFTQSGRYCSCPLMQEGKSILAGSRVLTAPAAYDFSDANIVSAPYIVLQTSRYSQYGAMTSPAIEANNDGSFVITNSSVLDLVATSVKWFMNTPLSTVSDGVRGETYQTPYPGMLYVYYPQFTVPPANDGGTGGSEVTYGASPLSRVAVAAGQNNVRMNDIPNTVNTGQSVTLLLPVNMPMVAEAYYRIRYVVRPVGSTQPPNTEYTGAFTLDTPGTFEIAAALYFTAPDISNWHIGTTIVLKTVTVQETTP